MSAYYNEHDPYAAAWLRELIKAGHIAPGEVDERSIEDVLPTDLVGFTQCHFFAGIAVWSAALRGAGWPDDRPVWTGSCPCQPFSTAGQGKGTADERHLWPAWLHLIKHGKGPGVPVFGEQVASSDGLAWLDIVLADLEAEGYTPRALDRCSAGLGSPNIRQRLFFHAARLVGDTNDHGQQGSQRGNADPQLPPTERAGQDDWLGDTACGGRERSGEHEPRKDGRQHPDPGSTDGLGNTDSERARGNTGALRGTEAGEGRRGSHHDADAPGVSDGMANPGYHERSGRDAVRGADEEHAGAPSQSKGGGAERERTEHDSSVRSAGDGVGNSGQQGSQRRGEEREKGDINGQGAELWGTASESSDAHGQRPGPTNGFWGSADWLFCKDGKWRPVEPGTFPLADGTTLVVGRMQPRLEELGIDPKDIARILGRRGSTLAVAGRNRVGRLRGYGNAINKEVAQTFIKAVMDEEAAAE